MKASLLEGERFGERFSITRETQENDRGERGRKTPQKTLII